MHPLFNIYDTTIYLICQPQRKNFGTLVKKSLLVLFDLHKKKGDNKCLLWLFSVINVVNDNCSLYPAMGIVGGGDYNAVL